MKNPSVDPRTLGNMLREESGGVNFVTQAQVLAVTGCSADWWRNRRYGVRCLYGRPIKYHIPSVASAICNYRRRKAR